MVKIKNFFKNIILKQSYIKKIATIYCAHNMLLPEVFVRTTSKSLREMLGLPFNEHVSQLNQDIFALLQNKYRSGYFVEIGANNGFNLSNTVYLEECFGWSGLLIEANPKYLSDLKKRKAIVINKAVADKVGSIEFIDAGLYGGISEMLDNSHINHTEKAKKIIVDSTTLESILIENNAPNIINFISVDVEGGEIPIIDQMCALRNFRFLCGCIEHNYRNKEYEYMKIKLTNSGYQIVWEGMTCQDLYFVDTRKH